MIAGDDIVVELSDVGVKRDGSWILDGQSLTIRRGEQWVILGPNGAGKSTLVGLLSAQTLPTHGLCRWMGEAGTRIDRRALRRTIALVSTGLIERFPRSLSVVDVVVTGVSNVLAPYWDEQTGPARGRALELLTSLGFAEKVSQPFFSLSQGERQRVLVARAMMGSPDLVVLDEVMAGLDLGAREDLLWTIVELAQGPRTPYASVVVTHHLEEIPPSATHAHLLRAGLTIASGPIAETLHERSLSDAFGRTISIVKVEGRRLGFARRQGR